MCEDTCAAVDLLTGQGFFSEALVCLYSAIDALAWLQLDRPEHDATKKRDYIAWVRDHMDVTNRLRVSPETIYKARSALIHQRISRSDQVLRGEVAEIQYRFGSVVVGAPMLQVRSTNGSFATSHVVIEAKALVDAFAEATESARRTTIAKGTAEWNRVANRTQMFLLPMGPEIPHRLSRRDYPPDVAVAFGEGGAGT